MDQNKEPQTANTGALKTKINPVVVYCIIGAVVAFNVILYLYVMDRLNQLDKEKAELLNSIKQYQEVPLPDLMKDPSLLKDPGSMQDPQLQSDQQLEKLDRLEKELGKTTTEREEALQESIEKSKEPTNAKAVPAN